MIYSAIQEMDETAWNWGKNMRRHYEHQTLNASICNHNYLDNSSSNPIRREEIVVMLQNNSHDVRLDKASTIDACLFSSYLYSQRTSVLAFIGNSSYIICIVYQCSRCFHNYKFYENNFEKLIILSTSTFISLFLS